jgi:hypothetical protein
MAQQPLHPATGQRTIDVIAIVTTNDLVGLTSAAINRAALVGSGAGLAAQ